MSAHGIQQVTRVMQGHLRVTEGKRDWKQLVVSTNRGTA